MDVNGNTGRYTVGEDSTVLQSILKGSNIRHLIHSGSHNISGVKSKRGIKTLGTV